MSNVAQENAPLLNAIGLKKILSCEKRDVCKNTASESVRWCVFFLRAWQNPCVVGESGCGNRHLVVF